MSAGGFQTFESNYKTGDYGLDPYKSTFAYTVCVVLQPIVVHCLYQMVLVRGSDLP